MCGRLHGPSQVASRSSGVVTAGRTRPRRRSGVAPPPGPAAQQFAGVIGPLRPRTAGARRRAAVSNAESDGSQATAIWMGPRTAASATASNAARARRFRQHRARSGSVASAAAGVAWVALRCAANAAPRHRDPRRGWPVQRIGGPQYQCLGVIGGVEPVPGALGVGEVFQCGVDQPGGHGQPGRRPGQLVQPTQRGGQRRVVLQDPRAVAGHTAEAGPAQPPVDQLYNQQPTRTIDCGSGIFGLLQRHRCFQQRGDGQGVPGGDHLVVAARLGSLRPHAAQGGRTACSGPSRRDRRAAAAPSCRARRCLPIYPEKRCGQSPSAPRTSRSWSGVHT